MGFLSEHWGTEQRLTELLDARPDFDSPPLRSMAELDYRSRSDPWFSNGMKQLDAIAWALVQASCLSAPQASLQHLAEIIGEEASMSDVSAAAAKLQRLGMAVVEGGSLQLDPHMRLVLEGPGGLGPWASELMNQQNVDSLRKIVERLGGTVRSTRKADLVAQALTLVDDKPTLHRAIDSLPPHAHNLLERLAMGSAYVPEPGWYTPSSTPTSAMDHLTAIGFLLPAQRHHRALIREVSLLLRGGRQILLPKPPPLRTAADLDRDETARLTERSCLAAATMLSDLNRLCALIERTPLQRLKSGGVGSSQIKTVAKELSLEPIRVADLIDAAAMCGFVEVLQPPYNPRRRQTAPPPATVVLADLYNRRQVDSLAAQWCYVVESWYFGMLGVGYGMRPNPLKDNKLEPAMWNGVGREGGQLRRSLADLLRAGNVAPAVGRGAWFAWHQPWTNVAGLDVEAFVSDEIDFLETLGVSSDGFVHEAGRALLADLALPDSGSTTSAAVIERVEQWLGTNTSVLTVQGDMTIIITGHAPAALTGELILMADVVSQGHATVYRISEASLHRAFEHGRTAAGLIDLLTEYGSTALPNAVATLFGDAERRFGRFRVCSPASVIVVADALAAAELASSRNAKVKGLRLARLGETVFASSEPMNQVLVILKEAGMAATSAVPAALEPLPVDDTSPPAGRKRSAKPVAPAVHQLHFRRRRSAVTGRAPADVARQLLSAPAPPPAAPPRRNTEPGDDLLEILETSIETGEPLTILFVERSGKAKTVTGVVERLHGGIVQVVDEYNRSKLIPLDLIIATSNDGDEEPFDDESGGFQLGFDDFGGPF